MLTKLQLYVRHLLLPVLLLTGMLSWGQATLPVTRTIWNGSAPTGWTDAAAGSYTSSFACSGSNGSKFDTTGDYYLVNFDSAPDKLSFQFKSNNSNSTSTLLVEQSANGTDYTTVVSLTGNSGIPNSCTTKGPYQLNAASRYVRWKFTKGSSNGTMDDVSITKAVGSIITTGAVATTPFCVTSSVAATGTVAYSSSNTTFTGNTFTAQLSNASGSFSSPVTVGTSTSTATSGSINITIPAGTATGTGYKIRVVSSSPALTGSESAAFTVNLGAGNVSSNAATPANHQLGLAWTNPSTCFDEILVIAKSGSAVTATPTGDGTTYTANATFGSGTAITTGEYVVYKGSGSAVIITALTNGTTYHYTIFTRKNSSWSSGVTGNGIPSLSYCSASSEDTDYEYISDVNFNGSSNNSSASTYSDFTAVTFNVQTGYSYPVTITNGSGYSSDQLNIWIDWNADGDFDDTDETITLSNNTGAGPYSGTIFVPYGAEIGSTRMRIRLFDSNVTATATACVTTTYGEVEDYTIAVAVGIGPLDTPTNLAASNISHFDFTANWNEVDDATGYRIDVGTTDFTTTTGTTTTETFSNAPTGGSGSYLTRNWTGVDGITWNAYKARTDLTFNGTALTFRDESGSYLESGTITGGVKSISLSVVRAYGSGTGTLTIKVLTGTDFSTTTVIGTHSYTGSASTYTSGTITGITGDFKIRIENGIAERGTIDDLVITRADFDNTAYVSGYQNLAVATNSKTVTGLAEGTTYYFRVRAEDTGTDRTSSGTGSVNVTTNTRNVWNGTAWTTGTAPTTTQDAIIQGEYSTAADAQGENDFANLIIETGGSFTIAAGTNQNVTGRVINNLEADDFIIEDNANLIQTEDITNTGAITVNKIGTPLYRMDYTIWSAPVTGQNLFSFSPATLENRFYTYNTATSAYSHVFPDNATASFEFQPGEGYLIRMPNGYSAQAYPGYNEGTLAIAYEGVFTGVPNNGTVNLTLSTEGEGYNIVGNPYPSPINVYAFFDGNTSAIDNGSALYFWRKRNDPDATTYATITKLGYNANTAGQGEYDPGNAFDGDASEFVINPGQGFFVQATGTSLEFNNSMRSAVNNGQFFRTAEGADDDNDIISRFKLNITGEVGFTQTTIGYTGQTTNGLDYGWDGKAFVNEGVVSIYSWCDATPLAIQAKESFTVTDKVPLTYRTGTAGTFTIALDSFDGVFAQGQDIFLKDKATAAIHNLKESAYEFTSEAGTFDNRFEVVYQQVTLDNENPELAANSVIVYQNNGAIHINSGNVTMTAVSVYDVRGRMLYSNSGINSNETAVTGLTAQHQVLIVTIATEKGSVSKKVVH